ncbi:DNA-directed RNA polymerase subunit B'', partial [Candidatus Woesearchaeota archaeon]|nr:DNA-directed RNA polymerase subunit B'' [Candidatus Woesearchaeota archaeon]
MSEEKNLLINKYFEENNFAQSNIESYNSFVEWRLQALVDELGDATPAVIPPESEEVKFKFGKIIVEKPNIVEADGAKRNILPVEARMRNLTYAAPVYLEVSLIVDGKEKERAEVPITELPVMLKSKLCYLNNLSKEELIKQGEDPYDRGGYFIVNGTERTLSLLEDLSSNSIFVSKEKTGPITHSARLFSISKIYKIPHTLERKKDGLFLLTFAGLKRVPAVILFKALGITKDADIPKLINLEGADEDIYINLYDFIDIKSESAAHEKIGKMSGMTLTPEQRQQRIEYLLDNLLFPHIGSKPEDRKEKAYFLGRMIRKLLLLKQRKIKEDDKDHYKNKRVRLAGDLLEDLFRANMKILVNDMLYIFQRGVRRGKILPIKSIVRTKLLTKRVKSAMATGNWTGNRQGVSQRLERDNSLSTLSHLRRVASLLESTRESFEARELHATHWGRLCPLESPEGKNIGLRKNLALLTSITSELKETQLEKLIGKLNDFGLKDVRDEKKLSDVFLNGALVGGIASPHDFIGKIIAGRRKGEVTKLLNLIYNKEEDSVFISVDKNRVRRPLIIVKNGKPLLTEEHKNKLKTNELQWSDLVKEGIIEYIDALEEESALVALSEEKVTDKHTHLEINPIAIFGICTSMVPYANFNQSSRLNRGQKTQKQAMGCYALNFQNRMDTAINLLHYPQKPIVRTFTQKIFGEELSAGQNLVIAVLNYEGYNMQDAIVVNRAAIDRGFGRSTYFRPYVTERLRYPGGVVDEIIIPDKDVQGYTVERDYRFLNEDGIIYPEAEVSGGEVLIGKTSPPRFLGKLEAFSTAANVRKDASIRVRYGEHGIVNKVVLTENVDGSTMIKVDIRNHRLPEVGDKFSNRHGQKGVIGRVVSPEDIPFTANGISPDIIFSPNGLPRRMTVSHLIEALGGKVGALAGRNIDGTAFQAESAEKLRNELLELGFREDGTETLYDGRTGKEYPARIFVGNMYYLRLKHQVADKIQARARGPVTLLTRQPTEGKAKEGGLRLGEMEKDCFVAHGASLLMKERFDSDRT